MNDDEDASTPPHRQTRAILKLKTGHLPTYTELDRFYCVLAERSLSYLYQVISETKVKNHQTISSGQPLCPSLL